MGSKAQPAGKTWWEQQRTGLSRLIAVLAFLVVALTESRWELHQEPVAIFLFSIGLALAAVGAAGRIWCSFFISGRKDGQLVSEGPYSISRNPLYVFSCIACWGWDSPPKRSPTRCCFWRFSGTITRGSWAGKSAGSRSCLARPTGNTGKGCRGSGRAGALQRAGQLDQQSTPIQAPYPERHLVYLDCSNH